MSEERMTMIEPDWPEWLFHVQRYAYACRLVSGARVLDCASGDGYGTDLMANYAKHCVGVDISETAVAGARARYGSTPNLSFMQGSITELPFPDDSFDVVTCLETIEHIGEADQRLAIAELRRVLRPGGMLLLSTPDRLVSEARGYSNPFHVRELSVDEIKALVAETFPEILVLCQELNMMGVMSPIHDADGFGAISDVVFAKLHPDTRLTLSRHQRDHFYLFCVLSDVPFSSATAHALGAFAREPAFQVWNKIDRLQTEKKAVLDQQAELQKESLHCQAELVALEQKLVVTSSDARRAEAAMATVQRSLILSEDNNRVLARQCQDLLQQTERQNFELADLRQQFELAAGRARKAEKDLALGEKNNVLLSKQYQDISQRVTQQNNDLSGLREKLEMITNRAMKAEADLALLRRPLAVKLKRKTLKMGRSALSGARAFGRKLRIW